MKEEQQRGRGRTQVRKAERRRKSHERREDKEREAGACWKERQPGGGSD